MTINQRPGDVTVAIYANDIDEARDFYCTFLDFEVEIDTWIEIGSRVAPLRRTRLRLKSNSTVGLELMKAPTVTERESAAPSATPALPNLTILVADCGKVAERMSKLQDSSRFLVDQGSTPYAEYLTVRDPYGNTMQVMEMLAWD